MFLWQIQNKFNLLSQITALFLKSYSSIMQHISAFQISLLIFQQGLRELNKGSMYLIDSFVLRQNHTSHAVTKEFITLAPESLNNTIQKTEYNNP